MAIYFAEVLNVTITLWLQLYRPSVKQILTHWAKISVYHLKCSGLCSFALGPSSFSILFYIPRWESCSRTSCFFRVGCMIQKTDVPAHQALHLAMFIQLHTVHRRVIKQEQAKVLKQCAWDWKWSQREFWKWYLKLTNAGGVVFVFSCPGQWVSECHFRT